MADDSAKEAQKAVSAGAKPNKLKGMLWLVMLAVMIAIGSTAGMLVGGLFSKNEPAAATEPAGAADAKAEKGKPEKEAPKGEKEAKGEKAEAAPRGEFLYYDMDPIVVNLDEQRLARYVRAGITLAIKVADGKKVKEVLDTKKPEVKNWLTLKLAGCSLDSVRGEKNLNRLRREIRDKLNEQLWPDGKPLIEDVLLREFAIQ